MLDEKCKIEKRKILQSFCDSLNRLLKIDPSLINKLYKHAYMTNKAVRNDPSFIIRCESEEIEGKPTIGFIGILNGLLIDAFGDDYRIAYMIDEDAAEIVQSFVMYEPE